MTAMILALLAALCFGAGMITSRIGLRHDDARTGAAISIPTATLLFVIAAPFTIEFSAFNLTAALIFALVGLFYPALVTLLTFRANEELGPTVTSAISGTAPLFAMLAAALLLGEQIPPQAAIAALGVAAGVALLSWRPGTMTDTKTGHRPGRALVWPVAGAIVRGVAQAGAKAGLLLWGNPFAAGVIGYLVSSTAVLGAEQLRHGGRKAVSRAGLLWFSATGAINGGAMVLMYSALAVAPVATVAPVIAAYPLVTALASALFLRSEKISVQIICGAVLTVTAIVYLATFRTS
ncbi:MAG: DMT family transporter [Burkholderiales bacterium]|nr:DMT family transporter [Burkholderiales bacterium]